MWENVRWVARMLEEEHELLGDDMKEGKNEDIRNRKKRTFRRKLDEIKFRIVKIEEEDESEDMIRIMEKGPENIFEKEIYEEQKMLEIEELGMDEECSEFENKELFDKISMKNMLREADSKITALNIIDIIISKVLDSTRLREMDALQLKSKILIEDISTLRMNRVHEALSSMRMQQSEPAPKKGG